MYEIEQDLWEKLGFSKDEIKEWTYYKFDPIYAKKWRDAGFSPSIAATWDYFQSSFPKLVISDRNQLLEITNFIEQHFDDTIWSLENLFCIGINTRMLYDFLKTIKVENLKSFLQKEYPEWDKYQFKPVEAYFWKTYYSNITPKEAAIWRETNLLYYEVDVLREKQLKAEDIKYLTDTMTLSLEDILKWLSVCSIEETKQWFSLINEFWLDAEDLTPRKVKKLKEAGLTPQDVKEKLLQGMFLEEILDTLDSHEEVIYENSQDYYR